MDIAATPETGPVDAPASIASVLAEFNTGEQPSDDKTEEVLKELKEGPATDKEVKEPDSEGEAKAPDAEESATDPTDEAEEPDADTPDADETEDTDPPADEPKYKVKVNGEEQEVPLSELQKGYSRNEDYKAKTMALADERRALDQAKATVEADVKGQYANELRQQIEAFEALDPVLSEARQIDWDRLKAEDPATFVQYSDAVQQRLALIEQHRGKIAQIEREQGEQYAQREETARVQRLETAANKLVETMPELAEGDNFSRFATDSIGYLREIGFTPEEINEAVDDRALLLADKARRWDALQRAKTGLPGKKIIPKSSVKSLTSDASDSSRSPPGRLKPGASRDDAVAFALRELKKE